MIFDLTGPRYRLATMEVATRQIELLPDFGAPKSINPQWTADGQNLNARVIGGDPDADMVEYLGHVNRELARERRKLKDLDDPE